MKRARLVWDDLHQRLPVTSEAYNWLANSTASALSPRRPRAADVDDTPHRPEGLERGGGPFDANETVSRVEPNRRLHRGISLPHADVPLHVLLDGSNSLADITIPWTPSLVLTWREPQHGKCYRNKEPSHP
jgi:hypothetical protein